MCMELRKYTHSIQLGGYKLMVGTESDHVEYKQKHIKTQF